MNHEPRRLPSLFLDDGHPEARDYDGNYVVLDPQRPRGLLRLLSLGSSKIHRDARPLQTERIAAGDAPISA